MAAISNRRTFTVLSFVTDAVLYWVGLNVATLARLHTLIYADLDVLQRDRMICVAFFMMTASMAGAYTVSALSDRFDSIYYTWIGLGVAVLIQLLLVALVPDAWREVSIREIGLGAMAGGILIALWRVSSSALAPRAGALSRHFLVAGLPAETERICEEINQRFAATMSAEGLTTDAFRTRLEERAKSPQGELVEAILVGEGKGLDDFLGLIDLCINECERTFLYPSLHDTLFFQHRDVLAIAGIPLVEVGEVPANTGYLRLKRLIDVVVATIGILLAIPVCLVAAIGTLVTSPGPILYRQERVGMGGRVFSVYKFRSMKRNAEEMSGPVLAEDKDPRLTPIGGFIRRHRIDEIPQLWNVLIGDMSMVGPRPERPHFHEIFCKRVPLFHKRLAIRPGLSSLSHVLGFYDSDPRDRLRYDLMYISGLSFTTDIRVLIATVRVVLSGKGAL